MATVHYFQRYSSVENTVTNNTLQLISLIYAHSPRKAEDLINELIGADEPLVEIGLDIQQQQGGQGSVPDATISQRSFKILIETKVNSRVDKRQLIRHANGFADEETKILLLLTRERYPQETARVQEELASIHPGVILSNVTFEDIIRALDGMFKEYEYQMFDLVEDYRAYCSHAELVDRSPYLIRAVACGTSLTLNMDHGIYFHSSNRGYQKHRYTGVYKDKRVQAIWENDSVFDVTLNGDHLDKTLVDGRDTDEYDGKLRSIIAAAKRDVGWDVSKGHRFFCGTPYPTSFAKTSWGGLQSVRYFDVRNFEEEFSDAEELAAMLSTRSWD